LSDIFVTWDGATLKFESSNQLAVALYGYSRKKDKKDTERLQVQKFCCIVFTGLLQNYGPVKIQQAVSDKSSQ